MTHQIKEPEKASVVSREQLFSRARIPTKTVNIDPIGEVQIRGLTAPEVQSIKSGAAIVPGGKPSDDMFAILSVVSGMVSPALTREDIATIKKEWGFALVHKISGEIMKLSGVGEETKNA